MFDNAKELRRRLQDYVTRSRNCPCQTATRSDISGVLTLHHINCFAIQHNLEHHLSMAAFTQLRNGVFDVMEELLKIPSPQGTEDHAWILGDLEKLVGPLPTAEVEEEQPTQLELI